MYTLCIPSTREDCNLQESKYKCVFCFSIIYFCLFILDDSNEKNKCSAASHWVEFKYNFLHVEIERQPSNSSTCKAK